MFGGAVGRGRIGPLADGTRVYVDELTFGIVAHAACAKGKRGVAQVSRWNARDPDVECIGFDVLGVLGCVGGSTLTESVVRFFGSVAAQDLDDAAGPIELGKHGVEHVEGAGIVSLDLVVMGVTQKLAELVESFGDVLIAHSVNDGDDLASLPRELELILLAILRRRVVVGDEPQARQSNVRQHVLHCMEARMLVALGVARAGRGTDGDEHNKGSEGANRTGRSEAANRHGEMQRQNGKTPEFNSQLWPVAHPRYKRGRDR